MLTLKKKYILLSKSLCPGDFEVWIKDLLKLRKSSQKLILMLHFHANTSTYLAVNISALNYILSSKMTISIAGAFSLIVFN